LNSGAIGQKSYPDFMPLPFFNKIRLAFDNPMIDENARYCKS